MPLLNKSLIISGTFDPILRHLKPNIPLHLWVSSSVLTAQTDLPHVYVQLVQQGRCLRSLYAIGQGAAAAKLEDGFDDLWERQQENILASPDQDVLLSISCPYEDEDFEFIASDLNSLPVRCFSMPILKMKLMRLRALDCM